MKLINNFFYITRKDEMNSLPVFQVKLRPDHFIYSVHFPNNPVTPGVCLVQMAIEILEQHFQRPLQLDTAVNIKFKKPIHPDTEPMFIFNKLAWDGNLLAAQVSVEDKDSQFVKMSLRLK